MHEYVETNVFCDIIYYDVITPGALSSFGLLRVRKS